MFPTLRSCVNRTSREIRSCRRNISKTSTAPNSDAITRQQKVELDQNLPPNKWIRLNRHNNNRALSTIQTKGKPQAAGYTLVTKDESREFMATFPDIVRDLTDAGKQTDIPEVTKHFSKVLHYNVPNGKKTRGLAVVAAYKMLEKPENLTPDNIMKANIMGWCVELLNGALYVIDDILDHSENRRGVPCWYRTEDVGLRATNDAALMEEGAYSLLKANFANHHCYVPALERFQDIALTASMGQTLDSLINKGGRPNFELFTMSKYNTLIKYKTAYYTLQWPTTLAMYLANLYDAELHRQANAVLWEMGVLFQAQLQAHFLVHDDIMDHSEMRRGVPCWYRKDNIGLNAINDGLLLQSGIYALLKRHFSGDPCYTPTLELFHDISLKTVMGQTLDCMSTKGGKPNFELFTMKKYNSIVKYKTAYYTFQLPMALAMYLANLYDPEMHRQAKTILLEMGMFYQIQDDFLDCFGDSELTGKKGNDIASGKCSWLAVVALQRANPAQRKIMEENYGKSDPEAIKTIRNLYEELSLPNTYAIYEEESFNIIRTHVQQISKGLPHKLFFKLMEKIYKRDC